MLKKAQRLSTKQFMEVMDKGRIVTSPLFVVRILQNKDNTIEPSTSYKISAVAPKKVALTAVLRNRVRRQIYEAVKPLKPNLVQGISMIIFAKKETLKSSIIEMTADLKQLFSKAKISV